MNEKYLPGDCWHSAPPIILHLTLSYTAQPFNSPINTLNRHPFQKLLSIYLMNLNTKTISPGGPDSFQCLLWMTKSHSSSEPWACKPRQTPGTAGLWVCRQNHKTYTAVNFFPRKQTTQKISSCFSFLLLLSLLFLLTFETYVLLPHSCCHHPSPPMNQFIAWIEGETSHHWFRLYPDVTCQH